MCVYVGMNVCVNVCRSMDPSESKTIDPWIDPVQKIDSRMIWSKSRIDPRINSSET